jgi:hypothetical protein
MRAIEVTIRVSPEGDVQVEGLADLPPGKHQALLVVDQPARTQAEPTPKPPLKLTMLDWSAWPADSTFRREDLYGDMRSESEVEYRQ